MNHPPPPTPILKMKKASGPTLQTCSWRLPACLAPVRVVLTGQLARTELSSNICRNIYTLVEANDADAAAALFDPHISTGYSSSAPHAKTEPIRGELQYCTRAHGVSDSVPHVMPFTSPRQTRRRAGRTLTVPAAASRPFRFCLSLHEKVKESERGVAGQGLRRALPVCLNGEDTHYHGRWPRDRKLWLALCRSGPRKVSLHIAERRVVGKEKWPYTQKFKGKLLFFFLDLFLVQILLIGASIGRMHTR